VSIWKIFTFSVTFLWASQSLAQTAVTLGTTPTMAIFPAQNRQKLSICNVSTAANIGISFGATVPGINSAGSYTVPFGACLTWPSNEFPPQEQVNGIANMTSTPVTMDQR